VEKEVQEAQLLARIIQAWHPPSVGAAAAHVRERGLQKKAFSDAMINYAIYLADFLNLDPAHSSGQRAIAHRQLSSFLWSRDEEIPVHLWERFSDPAFRPLGIRTLGQAAERIMKALPVDVPSVTQAQSDQELHALTSAVPTTTISPLAGPGDRTMGKQSDSRLKGGLHELLQTPEQPKTLKLVLVISDSFLESFNGNKPLSWDDPQLLNRNQELRSRIQSAISRQNYFADNEGWDFSYHCVYLTLKSFGGFDVTHVAQIAPPDLISEIWHNATYRTALDKSITTIKVDDLRRQHGLKGQGVVWAVVDTGIKATHPGFGGRVITSQYDLTKTNNIPNNSPDDKDGHGTHVAGIIGGYLDAQLLGSYRSDQQLDGAGNAVPSLSGVAPEIQLVNLKVIEHDGDSNNTDALDKALGKILSGEVVVDGVNLSLQNDPNVQHWCSGDCPVCTRIKQITGKGIIVCAAAGNQERLRTIACPGRAEAAITVGACHKSDPFVYGVHYDSAGGPTPDGRPKPDVVAPGADILSYGIQFATGGSLYVQKTGTSMATPFVSGLCALLLEERRAAKKTSDGKLMKEILSRSAANLNRAATLQGSGLINAIDALADSQTQ
jgi:hypothetical protein